MRLDPDASGWAISEGHTGEYPFQIRFRRFGSQLARSAFPYRMNIFWTMNAPDNQGFATKSELQQLHRFEDRLVQAAEKDRFSVIAVVLTGRNEREFVFYTSDPNEFVNRLAKMPQEEYRYPINVHCTNDDQWEYFDAVAG